MTSAEEFLAAVSGFAAATKRPSSTDRPVKLAVVDPSYTSGWPKVTFEGESTLSGKLYPHLDSYCPSANDRVVMVPVGTTWLIVGAVSSSGSGTPPGSIQLFAASTPPGGWLACDGSAVSRTTYARLFAAIGTTWGVGDGSTTFNLPDLRGRAPVGAGSGAGLTARTLADTGGAEDHTLSETNLAAHTHTGPSHTHSGPSHTHTGPSHTHSGPSHTHSIGSHTHGYATWQTQQSTTVSPGPNGYTMTSDSGTTASGGSGTTGSGGTGSTGSGGSGDTGSGGTGSTGSGGTGATGSTGSGTAVGHMPPFAAVTYIIRT